MKVDRTEPFRATFSATIPTCSGCTRRWARTWSWRYIRAVVPGTPQLDHLCVARPNHERGAVVSPTEGNRPPLGRLLHAGRSGKGANRQGEPHHRHHLAADSAGGPLDALNAIISKQEAHKVCLGTDYPLAGQEPESNYIDSLPFTTAEIEGILEKNARRLIGL